MQKITYKPSGKVIENNGKRTSDLKNMCDEIFQSKELTIAWFLREFRAKYRQTILGLLWAVFVPVITLLVFVIMRHSGVINVGNIRMPYPLFAMVGLTAWSIFSTGVIGGAQSLSAAGNMIVKINFPKISVVIAATSQGLVDFIIKFFLMLCLMRYYHFEIQFTGVMKAIGISFFIYVFTLGISFFLSIAASFMHDISKLLGFVLVILLFLTPVLFLSDDSGPMALINQFNPLTHMILAFRGVLVIGNVNNFVGLLSSIFISCITFLIGWRFLYVSQTAITERV